MATSPTGTGQFILEADAAILWWDRDGMGGLPSYRLASLPGATGMGAGELVVIA